MKPIGEGKRIIANPGEDDWKELVFPRARQILDRAIRGLSLAA
ncbi:MAG TPA: hypothetical protein QGF63_11845 [Alphaproteobacteria bacterium]|nr:hypothetical protein [Alphaproteobacteria bacterium]MDP6272319.1 hypothetical protein [Alphaproteobacteria bacterium]HJM50528.1 hypothetical protein [Alphaproteobacteria bacterium]